MTERIADLPTDERPRERMLLHGAETLSDSELVAILLGSGVNGQNSIQLARQLLKDGGIRSVRLVEARDLAERRGVGPAKATRIAAAFEIARRLAYNVPEEPPEYDGDQLARELIAVHARQMQERLGAVFLDSRRRVLKRREIYVGTINSACVSARDIMRYVFAERAVALVLYHNHPSGSPTPSHEDLVFTERMKTTLEMIDVKLLDHLVIGAHGYYSMHARGHV